MSYFSESRIDPIEKDCAFDKLPGRAGDFDIH